MAATFDRATSRVRRGFEAVQNLPAAVAAMDWEPGFTSDDTAPEKEDVENPNIVGTGHQAKPIPGKLAVGGSAVAAPDADNLVGILSALRNVSAATALDDGTAFQFTAGRSQAVAIPETYTKEVDQDDGINVVQVGGQSLSFALVVASGAATQLTVEEAFAFESPWVNGVELHPNPGTGTVTLRGNPPEWVDRQDSFAASAKDMSLQLVDIFTDADSKEQTVWLARMGTTTTLTGTWAVTISTAAYTGTGGAANTELLVGDVIGVEGELHVVATITDDDTFTTTDTHSAGASGATITREYGGAAAGVITGLTFFQARPGTSTQTTTPRWSSMKHSFGGFMGARATAGVTTELNPTATTSMVAGVAAALTGTVSVAASDATITGSGTAFLSECYVGGFITTPGDTVGKRILSIGSDTTMEADSDYTAIETAVTMTQRPIPVVALTGTITTAAASDAVVGVATLFTTELAVGSWIRTAGGVVRRVRAITDATNLNVDFDYTGIEAGVAAATAYEYTVGRTRADWARTVHPSGPFPELLAEPFVFFSTTSVPEERQEVAESLTINFTAGRAPVLGIGSAHAAKIQSEGQSTGTLEMVTKLVNSDIRKSILNGEDVRVRLVMSTGVTVATSNEEYTWEWVAHLRGSGKPTSVPDTANQITLSGPLFDDATDTDFPDALNLRFITDRSTVVAVS